MRSVARSASLILNPVIVSSVARMGIQALAFAQVVVVSRYLDLAQFGLFAIASAIAVILCSLLYTGFYEGLLRSDDLDREAPTVLLLLTALGTVFGLAMALFALAVGYETPLGALLLPLALVPVLAGPTAWCEALGIRRGAVGRSALLTLAAEGAGFVVLVLALRSGAGPMALVWSRLVATAASLLLKLPLARGTRRRGFVAACARAAWARARPLYLGAGAKLVSGYGADFILALFLSPAAVGAFRAGARVANTGAEVIVRPIHAVAWSRFAKLERHHGVTAGGPLREAWLRDTAFLTAVAWPALVGLACVAEPVTVLVLGAEWSAAAPIIAILALTRAIAATDFLLDPLLVCVGRSDLQMRLRVGSALLSIALVTLLAPMGILTAALAQCITALLTLAMALTIGTRVLDLEWRRLAHALLPAAFLVGLVALSAWIASALTAGTFAPALALSSVIGGSGAVWLAVFAVFLVRGRLTLPAV